MKAILFDLDGTLVDSSKGIKGAFIHTFNTLHLPLPSDEELSTFIGPPLEATFPNFLTTETEIQHAISIFREYYRNIGVHQVSLYPKIIQLLTDLKALDYKLYITTSKNEPMANVMLKELDIFSFFDGIYGATPEHFHKADVIKACLSQQNISQKDAIIIGDTKFDIIGGQENNIATLAITWGFGSLESLQNSNATIICDTTDSIIKALKSLN